MKCQNRAVQKSLIQTNFLRVKSKPSLREFSPTSPSHLGDHSLPPDGGRGDDPALISARKDRAWLHGPLVRTRSAPALARGHLLSKPDRRQPLRGDISCRNQIGVRPRTAGTHRRPAPPIPCARWRIKRVGGQPSRFASSDAPIAAQSVHELSEDFWRLFRPLTAIRNDLVTTLDLARRR
jgi:hypothetical protein